MSKFNKRFAAYKREELNHTLIYYKNSYLPELRETAGFTQQERLEMAEKALKDFNPKTWKPTKAEQANYLRRIAIEARREADVFLDSNVYIKWRRLRECIEAIQELRTLYPSLELYSSHWLSLPKPIKVKD